MSTSPSPLELSRSDLRLYRAPADGESPPEDRLTLTDVLDRYWLPRVRVPSGSRPRTLEKERSAVLLFDALMGSPPVSEITEDLWAEFITRLRLTYWRGEPLASHSIRATCVHVKPLVEYCFTVHRRGAGLGLLEPMYLPLPRATSEQPQGDYSAAEADRLIQAAEAEAPAARNLGGIPPKVFWPNLLRFAWNTGLRPISIFGAQWKDVARNRPDWIWLPASVLKRKETGADFYLNARAREAAEAIGRRDGPLFPWRGWPASKPGFYRKLARITAAAGLTGCGKKVLYGLRSATLTWLSCENKLVAEIVADHRSQSVLASNYANRFRVVPPYLDRLPQPGSLSQRELF